MSYGKPNLKTCTGGHPSGKKFSSSPKPKPKPSSKKYSETELFDMNKKEQVELLESLGAEKIPRLESSRVKLILKLQGGDE